MRAIYQAGFNPKDIALTAEYYRYFTIFATLDEEDQGMFGQVVGYKLACSRASVLYSQCAQEAETGGIKIHDHPFYPDYLKMVSERNQWAVNLLGQDDWEDCWELAYSCGIVLNQDEVSGHSQGAIRENLLTQYRNTDSTLVKLLIALDLRAMMDRDKKEGQKSTLVDLYRYNLTPQMIQEEARQFDRLATHAALKGEENKKLYNLLVQYDDLHLESKRHYVMAFKEAEGQGIKKEQTEAYGLFQEVLKERQELAHQIHDAAKPTVIEAMAHDMGVSLKTLGNDLRHYEIGLAKKAISPNAGIPLEDKSDEGVNPTDQLTTSLEHKAPQPPVDIGIKKVPQQAEAGSIVESKVGSGLIPESKPNTGDGVQAAKAFVSLTEQYQKTHWQDPERVKIRNSLDKLIAQYWQDERFVCQVENSGSELAATRIKAEIHLMQTERFQDQNIVSHLGDSNIDVRFPSSSISKTQTGSDTAAQAAKTFVSLAEQYQKTHWHDPERAKISESLAKLVAQHWQDGKFVAEIEKSGSEVAMGKIKAEIHLAQTERFRSREQLDR